MAENGFRGGPNSYLLGVPAHPTGTGGRFGNALSVSIVAHAIGGLAILLLAGRLSPSHDAVEHLLQDIRGVAWIPEYGGGTGDRTPASPRPRDTTQARSDQRTLSPMTARNLFEVPAVTIAPQMQDIPGITSAMAPIAAAETDGRGAGGPGSGRGPGNGPGDRLGTGTGPGFGDGYVPGPGVNLPRLIREVKPGYTSDAMRARIQGTVRLQAVVATDGSVSAA